MDKSFKFTLPSPNFNKNVQDSCRPKPHYLTPSGMSLLPREKQPPPMYAEHGATLPARYLKAWAAKEQQLVTADASHPLEKQYCEPCELELHTLDDFKRHRAQHEKCPVAGCLFKGHPSVMDKHVSALHSSGLFDKFKKLSTPEEIAAWREERRKRYPTLANVLLKQKAKEQRQKRGERLENNKTRFGKITDRKRAQSNTQEDKFCSGEKRKRHENKRNRNKRNRRNKNDGKSIMQDTKTKVQDNVKQKDEKIEKDATASFGAFEMFRGTSQLENYKHFNDKKKSAANNVLSGLVGMYGSDDDDDESEDSNGDHVEESKVVNAFKSSNDDIAVKKFDEIEPDFNVDLVENNADSLTIETKANGAFPQNSKLSAESSGISPTLYEHSNSASKSEIEHPALIISPNETQTDNIEKPVFNKSKVGVTSKLNGDSSDEAPEEIPIQRNMPDYPTNSENNITSIDNPDTNHNKLTNQITVSKKQLIRRKFGLNYRKARLRKQNTMLEKLLETDIRRERNILLQCVRYVCENNFFNISQNESLGKNKL